MIFPNLRGNENRFVVNICFSFIFFKIRKFVELVEENDGWLQCFGASQPSSSAADASNIVIDIQLIQ